MASNSNTDQWKCGICKSNNSVNDQTCIVCHTGTQADSVTLVKHQSQISQSTIGVGTALSDSKTKDDDEIIYDDQQYVDHNMHNIMYFYFYLR